jgi:dUTP pyrophosphatase
MKIEVKKVLNIKVKKVHPNARMPTYATEGAACFDLYAATVNEKTIGEYVSTTSRMIVGTGLAFEIPRGYMMRIASRSGLAFKYGAEALHGVIDSDFRGEVKLLLRRWLGSHSEPLFVKPGDRIAQAFICEVPRVEFVEADSLTETDRGSGGFGSTGV